MSKFVQRKRSTRFFRSSEFFVTEANGDEAPLLPGWKLPCRRAEFYSAWQPETLLRCCSDKTKEAKLAL